MLNMLGEDARAAVGKVKSLQAQGATPEQVDMQLMEAARNGLLPISVAFAVQKALQRQNPTPPPPQGTVVGDMMQQLTGGQPSMPAAPPPPRQQGVAGLPNPVMDNSQFAGGGIVAFSGGGTDPHADDYLPRSNRNATVEAAEAEIAELETAAAKGTATPAQLTKLQRLRAFLTQPVTVQGARNVAGAAVERGVAGIGGLAKATALGAPLMGAAGARWQQNEVPAEYLDAYYANNGDTSGYWKDLDTPDKGDRKYTMSGTRGGDVLNRLHAALGKTIDIASFGLADTDPYSQYFAEQEARRQAAANAPAPTPTAPTVALPSLDRYKDPLLGQVNGLASLAQGPDMKGYEAQMEQYLKQSQEGVPTKAPTMDEAMAERRRLNEKAGVYKPIEASEKRIAERRAKAEAEGGKSILNELGLAFLTKGVMAAGEGKDTLSAMAYAIDDGAKSYKERKDRTDAILDKLDEAQTAVDNQKAAIASGEIAGAQDDVNRIDGQIRDARNQALNIRIGMLNTKIQLADSAATRRLNAAISTIQMKATLEEKDQLGRYIRRWEDLKSKGPKFKAQADAAQAEMLDFVKNTSVPYLANEADNASRERIAATKNTLNINNGGSGNSEGWNVEEVQ